MQECRNDSTTRIFISFMLPQKQITVFLAGDSTMSDKRISAYPETGWGMPFPYFFDSTVQIINKAQNGGSARTFIAEGLWKSIYDDIHPGDYVLIQFGHNDEEPVKTGYTNEMDFKNNLQLFITQSHEKQGIPILVTPVSRRSFDSIRTISTHTRFAEIIRETALANAVPLIDLENLSMALFNKLGPEHSKMIFNYLQPGEHPNYPDGREDDTHFNELGARLMAELVLNDIKEKKLELAKHIVIGQNKSK